MTDRIFKWMIYTLLVFLVIYHVSKENENVYIWFIGISVFVCGIGISSAIIDEVIKYNEKKMNKK